MEAHRTALLGGSALRCWRAAPAAAAPDLTLTASHARATFLRAQAPNTTLYARDAHARPWPTRART